MIREAVGVFDDMNELNAAVAELETTAFPRDAISVLGPADALKRRFGLPYMRPEDAEDNPDAPRRVLIRPEEKAIVLTATIGMVVYGVLSVGMVALGPSPTVHSVVVAALVGVVAALAVFLIADRMAEIYSGNEEEQLQAGGMVLWVRTPGPDTEDVARVILARHGAKDVHVHSTN